MSKALAKAGKGASTDEEEAWEAETTQGGEENLQGDGWNYSKDLKNQGDLGSERK